MKKNLEFQPARTSRRSANAKLMVLDPCRVEAQHVQLKDLPQQLVSGDVLVFNDAATIPASLFFAVDGESFELRLISNISDEFYSPHKWRAIVYHGGSWRDKTEARRLVDPKFVRVSLTKNVTLILSQKNGFLEAEFIGSSQEIWDVIMKQGHPIQYSYHKCDLELWDIQTIFASRPLAIEAPSAAFHFDWQVIKQLKVRGVEVVFLTHASGISSTGNVDIDTQLPFPERYFLPERTVQAVTKAKVENRRVIAVGTSATRALEDNHRRFRKLVSGQHVATVKLDKDFELMVVDGLISGLHEQGSSHLKLLEAFVDKSILMSSYRRAMALGYKNHEYGDLEFICSKCAI